jgi:hypothetical protein
MAILPYVSKEKQMTLTEEKIDSLVTAIMLENADIVVENNEFHHISGYSTEFRIPGVLYETQRVTIRWGGPVKVQLHGEQSAGLELINTVEAVLSQHKVGYQFLT